MKIHIDNPTQSFIEDDDRMRDAISMPKEDFLKKHDDIAESNYCSTVKDWEAMDYSEHQAFMKRLGF